MANKTKEAPSFALGRVFGYEQGAQSLLPFQKTTATNIHKAFSLCFDQYAVMFNTTASLFLMSTVYREDLVKEGMSNNMDKNFNLIVKRCHLEGPASTSILTQAYNASISTHNAAFVEKVKKGILEGPQWHDALSPVFIPRDCIEFLSVKAGNHKQLYLCVCVFSAKWASRNKLTHWLAFEIDEPGIKDPRKKSFQAMFGEPKAPHPTARSIDRIHSRIAVECYKPKGKFVLQKSASKEGPRYFIYPGAE